MQSKTAPQKYSTTDVIVPTPIMWRVKNVAVKCHLSLLVTFNDGTRGIVTIAPEWLTGVFAELKQPEKFNAVYVEHGAITWENGLDLDPKTMYDAISQYGSYYIQ